MELPVIGEKDVEDLDLDPIVVPIAGYEIPSRKQVVTKISFRPVVPLGAALDVIRQTRADGSLVVGEVLKYLDACVMPESADEWEAILHDSTLAIDQDTFVNVYYALTDIYSGKRPTQRSADSDGGPSSTKRTSKAGAGSRASKSKAKT